MNLILTVNNVESKFNQAPSDEVVSDIRDALRYENDANNPMMRKKFLKKNVTIAEYKYLYSKKTKSFPTGLLSEVVKILDNHKLSYKIIDKRPNYPLLNPKPLLGYTLRDYQLSSKDTALRHQNCIIRIATGGGKTAIMAGIAADLNGYRVVILVRRKMLLYQTIKVFQRELGEPIGQIGSGVVDIQRVTIAMVPTLARMVDPKWQFVADNELDGEDDDTKLSEEQKALVQEHLRSCEAVIPDECHMLGSDTAQIIMNYCTNARYRIGFSGSPWRDDGKDILLTAVTGPRVVDINASFLINMDPPCLVAPNIYFFKTPEVRIPLYMQGKYPDVYKEFIVENGERNALIITKAIEAYERGEKVLILVQQIEHGELFADFFEEHGYYADFICGARTMLARDEMIAQFQARTRSILIATNGTMSEGIDIPEITVLINASGGKSSVQYYQKIGRAIRLFEDKNRCIIIDFLDQNIKFVHKHAKARIRIINSEPAYKLKIQA
jgi:superfamily II DNA or RNA helicase